MLAFVASKQHVTERLPSEAACWKIPSTVRDMIPGSVSVPILSHRNCQQTMQGLAKNTKVTTVVSRRGIGNIRFQSGLNMEDSGQCHCECLASARRSVRKHAAVEASGRPGQTLCSALSTEACALKHAACAGDLMDASERQSALEPLNFDGTWMNLAFAATRGRAPGKVSLNRGKQH